MLKEIQCHRFTTEEATHALVLHVACDLVPFCKLESPHFRSFVSALDQRYQVPSRKHLVNTLLQEEATRVHSDVMQQLSCAESVCVTLDIWSSRPMRSYLGITGHFLVDWSMKSVVLACKRFRGRHTADSIRPTVRGNNPRVQHRLEDFDHCHGQCVEYGEGIFSARVSTDRRTHWRLW